MENLLRLFAAHVALGCELAAVAVLALAAVEGIAGVLLAAPRWGDTARKKLIWVRFASWLILALEFTLAADIARTAITPSWNDIGQLAAIAAIRTFLNLFLERDVEAYQRQSAQTGAPPA